jgi:hypothetical protein
MAEDTRHRYPVIVATTPLESLRTLRRLDAWYYLAPGAAAARSLEAARAAGVKTVRLGGADGLAYVWAPARFKRAYAAEGEKSLPYLAPHDIFEYLPRATLHLSEKRTRNLDIYRVNRGMVLQTCSGRNLGPSVIVDEMLERFVMSHDLVRIAIADERMRNYIVGFLHSKTGQGLLRRDKSGSVIDHITAGHVAAQEIPLLADDVIDRVADLVGSAFALVEQARSSLARALEELEADLPKPKREKPAKTGWGVAACALNSRLDAASYDPWVRSIRAALKELGGVHVGEVATVIKPAGRYKTYYVSKGYGLPILSGTQVLQSVLVKPQYMSPRAFDDVERYKLGEGWSAYMADGRVEKGLGVVAYVTRDRHGWLASGHVGRIIPKQSTHPGALWLAARTMHVQAQIKCLASGSVVDSTFPSDMESVVLPPLDRIDGEEVTAAWQKFADAAEREAEAINLIDDRIAELSGVDVASAEDLLAEAAAADDRSDIADTVD